jgi:hypothetical protein
MTDLTGRKFAASNADYTEPTSRQFITNILKISYAYHHSLDLTLSVYKFGRLFIN